VREVASPSPAEKPVPRGSETLLVVEDEDAVRRSEVEFLSAIGYTVLSAANGREALDRSEPRQIGLIWLSPTS
jgi:CheY-like chemotaxis protein